MTIEERENTFNEMLGEEVSTTLVDTYLRLATQKILNHRYPFDKTKVEIEPRFEMDMIELAIVLYNQRGAEGETQHNENGVSRHYRTEQEILKSIPRVASLPL